MTSQAEAILTNGVLKPDQPLSLADQTPVRFTMEPIEARRTSAESWEQLKSWVKQNPLHELYQRLTRKNAVDTNVRVYALDAD